MKALILIFLFFATPVYAEALTKHAVAIMATYESTNAIAIKTIISEAGDSGYEAMFVLACDIRANGIGGRTISTSIFKHGKTTWYNAKRAWIASKTMCVNNI